MSRRSSSQRVRSRTAGGACGWARSGASLSRVKALGAEIAMVAAVSDYDRARSAGAPASSRQTRHRGRQRLGREQASRAPLARGQAIPAANRPDERVEAPVAEPRGDLLLRQLRAAQELLRLALQVRLEELAKRA